MTELKAKPRIETGRKVNTLRRAGFLPAVLYGEGIKSQSIAVPYRDFEKAYKEAGESTLVQLEVEEKVYNVLIYDISNDPLRGNPIHADFYAVRMDKEIRTKVPLEFLGKSPAVKNEGGILVKVMQEIEIEALPKDLPHGLQIDLSSLALLESKLFVKDIILPEGVKILADLEEVIAIVETPRSEEELKALEEKPAGEVAPEVKTEREAKMEAKVAEEIEEKAGSQESAK